MLDSLSSVSNSDKIIRWWLLILLWLTKDHREYILSCSKFLFFVACRQRENTARTKICWQHYCLASQSGVYLTWSCRVSCKIIILVLAGVDRVLRVPCMIIGILRYCEAHEVSGQSFHFFMDFYGIPLILHVRKLYWLLQVGPKGLEFGRYSLDYHNIRNYLHVHRAWGKKR